MQCELKYLGPDGFERLIQSLLAGETYGDGPDGQREVVIRDANRLPALPGLTVSGYLMAQVKFKDPNTKTNEWTWLRENLKSELEGFREKAKQNEALKAAGKVKHFGVSNHDPCGQDRRLLSAPGHVAVLYEPDADVRFERRSEG